MSDTPLEIRQTFPRPGKVQWIGLRPARREKIEQVEQVQAAPGSGLTGDFYESKPGSEGKRQVTLIQAEHLPAIAALAGQDDVDPALLRRNLLVTGINLLALKDQRFRVGEAILEGTGNCHPCSLMEQNLGPGGYNAMRGHGGITARVIEGGTIKLGDPVEWLGPAEKKQG